jgi:serine/threonine-protein kinase
MVMDFIDGCCVSSIVDKDGAMPCHRALPIFIQVAEGLAHAHEQGIVHRDIKLSNIMLVTQNGVLDIVKIVDFGIAKQWLKTDNNMEAFTLAGEVHGSPLYMSPEQCRGITLDHRSDIYSLGSVMYEMLTGRPIFTGENPVTVMTKHIHEAPKPLGLPISIICGEIERIVLKALAKKPEDRYSTANDLKSDLQFSLCALTAASTRTNHAA